MALANVALAPSLIDTRDFYPKNVRILGFQITALMEHGYDPRPDLTDLLEAVCPGRFTVPVDAVFPLAEAAEAHRYLEARANRGKVMLTTASGGGYGQAVLATGRRACAEAGPATGNRPPPRSRAYTSAASIGRANRNPWARG